MEYLSVILGIGILLIALLISRTWRAAAKKGIDQVAGICSFALDQTTRKRANKAKALAFLQEKGELTNTDIREWLGVSKRTVVTYMSELEKEGQVEQIGETGRGVAYRPTQAE